MGAPKQKWTENEESALKAGVLKHGAGKWRAIQKDPCFKTALAARTNVDLKDKWRNLNIDSLPGKANVVVNSGDKRGRLRAESSSKVLNTRNAQEILPKAYCNHSVNVHNCEKHRFVFPSQSRSARAMLNRTEEVALAAIIALNLPDGACVTDILHWIQEHFHGHDNGSSQVYAAIEELLAKKYVAVLEGRYCLDGCLRRMVKGDCLHVIASKIDVSGGDQMHSGDLLADVSAAAALAVFEAEKWAREAEALFYEAENLKCST